MALLVALLVALSFPLIANAQCSTSTVLRVGGQIRVDAAVTAPLVSAGHPTTFIDLNRPAAAHVVADTATFAYQFFGANVTVQFASVLPLGRAYYVRNFSAPLQVPTFGGPPSGTDTEVHRVAVQPPVTFEPGDVLAVIVTPGAVLPPSLFIARGDGWAGALAYSGDLTRDGSVSLAAGLFTMSRSMIGAMVEGPVNCSQVPSPEVILPVTGDVTGRVHYTTDVSLYVSSALPTANLWPVQWTIRDRLQNSNAATILTGSGQTTRTGPFIGDSAGVLTTLPSRYLGPMIVSIPGASFLYAFDPSVRFSDDVIATARVAAQTAAGEIGSSIQGVSCDSLGHVISVPFHRTANQRVNVGIASAQLNSCGVFAPARTIFVEVNSGTEVGIPMPAESIQLDDITGDSSAIPDAKGLTDGVVRVAVNDEGARIVAYVSVVDNTSQASTITVGRVER